MLTCLIVKIWVNLYDVKEKQRHCDAERALRNRGKRKGKCSVDMFDCQDLGESL